jgi:hypothetical protein
MAQSPETTMPPVTEEAFLADRQHFWAGFCSATTFTVIAMVVLLGLMAIFLA